MTEKTRLPPRRPLGVSAYKNVEPNAIINENFYFGIIVGVVSTLVGLFLIFIIVGLIGAILSI